MISPLTSNISFYKNLLGIKRVSLSTVSEVVFHPLLALKTRIKQKEKNGYNNKRILISCVIGNYLGEEFYF